MGLDEEAEMQSALAHAQSVEDENQKWRILAIWHLVNGDETLSRHYYDKILAEDKRASKLFSPRLYLLQLSRIFPERESYTQLANWLEQAID
jgi:hypothetical protein